MANFWPAVNNVIRDADILLLLLDARFINETRNREVEDKVKREGKPLIYVITKSDLAAQSGLEDVKKTLEPCVFVSATKYHGVNLLRDRIIIEGKRAGKEKVKVGVLGYPNVGKSSLINAMNGRHAASTSKHAGHTKGVQFIRAGRRIMFLDTPGVIPYNERDTFKHALIGTIDYSKAKDPDLAVMEIMEQYPGKAEGFYKVAVQEDKEEALDEIAGKSNMLKRGGEPDTLRTARMILKDWQTGKIT